jgi:hypothetical protein
MEHAEVLELIELAAVEPGGLDRLAAGDTPDAAAVAGHLAGCADCRAELAAAARTAALASEAIRELPDPALKARTLAFVREVGVDRSAQRAAGASVAASATAPAESPFARPSAPTSVPVAPSPFPPLSAVPSAAPPSEPLPDNVVPIASRSRRTAWWAAASVAAVLVAGVAGFTAGGAAAPTTPPAVVTAAKTTMHIAEQPDAARVVLASTSGAQTVGSVLYSAATGELSMTATGLQAAPDGATYACWVEVDGQRRRIGSLYLEGSGAGAWVGWVDGLDKLGMHPVFGVSLVKDGDPNGTPLLRGGG